MKIRKILIGLMPLVLPITSLNIASCTPTTSKCTIQFDSMGGTQVEQMVIDAGSVITQPTSTKPYCVLEGWYTDRQCIYKFDFSNKISHNMKLYANWVFSGEVTKQQWQQAFNRIYNVGPDRNYLMLEYEHTQHQTVRNVYKVKNTQMSMQFNKDAKEILQDIYEVTYQNTNWLLFNDESYLRVWVDQEEYEYLRPINKSYLQDSAFIDVPDLISAYDDAQFNQDSGEYKVTINNKEFTIKFNQNLLIDSLETSEYRYEFSCYGEIESLGLPRVENVQRVFEFYRYGAYLQSKNNTAWDNHMLALMDLSKLPNTFDANKNLQFEIFGRTLQEEQDETKDLTDVYNSCKLFRNGILVDEECISLSDNHKQISITPKSTWTNSDVLVLVFNIKPTTIKNGVMRLNQSLI